MAKKEPLCKNVKFKLLFFPHIMKVNGVQNNIE